MLGKYNFTKKEAELVIKFFEPSVASIYIWIEYINDIFKINNLKFDKLDETINKLNKLEFLDEFQDLKDEFLVTYEKILYYLIKLDIEKINYQRDIIQPKMRVLKECFLLTDAIVKYCYDFVKKNKNTPNLDDLNVFFINRLLAYVKTIEFFNKNTKKNLSKQNLEVIEKMKACSNLEEWQKSLDLIIGDYEDNHLDYLYLNDDYNDYFWKIVNKISQMQAICEIAVNIKYNLNDNQD
ncbi:hypothetical protein [Spiroplasma tabanidicola]|uniref:Uncharacterized protein n=1 Tax=Spiroplasma tabanidicola TaxID=324079 RepID=A0A6I6CCN3_9MOLU|nr:hypothetical protein [Spiroplasma tabanidicola]QGS51902.1 hypothetical protein STABA_v1c05390 [Spiroplasma tabanidicola]